MNVFKLFSVCVMVSTYCTQLPIEASEASTSLYTPCTTIKTQNIPLALAATTDDIVVGCALKPFELYEKKSGKRTIGTCCGDGGVVINNQNRLCAVSRSGKVLVHEPMSTRVEKIFSTSTMAFCLTTHQDKLFIGSTDDMVHVWDVQGNLFSTFKGNEHSSSLHVNIIETVNDRIVTGNYSGMLATFDIESGAYKRWGAHNSFLTALAKYGERGLYSSGADGSIKIWDFRIARYSEVLIQKASISALACLTSGYLVSGNRNNEHINVYDPRMLPKALDVLTVENDAKEITGITALHALKDGNFVSTAQHGVITMWQPQY